MMAFFLLLSFILHIVSFSAIYVMFKQIQSLKTQSSKEVFDLFEVYLEEIKAENADLIQQLPHEGESSNQNKSQGYTDETKGNHSEQTESYQVPNPNSEDTFEQSTQAKVLHMHSQGYTAEAIAKDLDCGKTEAELIIKLYQT